LCAYIEPHNEGGTSGTTRFPVKDSQIWLASFDHALSYAITCFIYSHITHQSSRWDQLSNKVLGLDAYPRSSHESLNSHDEGSDNLLSERPKVELTPGSVDDGQDARAGRDVGQHTEPLVDLVSPNTMNVVSPRKYTVFPPCKVGCIPSMERCAGCEKYQAVDADDS
jgi:hypothetical protein